MKLRFYERNVYEVRSINHTAWEALTTEGWPKNVGFGDLRMEAAYDVFYIIADDIEEATRVYSDYFGPTSDPALIIVSVRLVGYCVERAAADEDEAD